MGRPGSQAWVLTDVEVVQVTKTLTTDHPKAVSFSHVNYPSVAVHESNRLTELCGSGSGTGEVGKRREGARQGVLAAHV